MTDELAERRLPDWARKLAEVRLGAEIQVGVFPHPEWVRQNPGVAAIECPEHLLRVQFGVIGHEHQAAVLAGQQDRNGSMPCLNLGFVPWVEWRNHMDAQGKEAAEVAK